MDDRLHFLIEFHMGHSALEEERVKCRHCTGLVHEMGWNITLTGDHVVRWAIAELEAGQTSEALVRLAAVKEPATWRDVADLFRVAYTDLGYDKFTKDQHLLRHAKEIAIRIADGRTAPAEGCGYIWNICEHLEFPSDLDGFTLDMLCAGCHPQLGTPLDDAGLHREIIKYARSIVDRISESNNKA